MSGPAPLPTAIKELRGNPGKRRLNAKEPKPRRVLPRAPTHLNAAAKKHWRKTARELHTLGLLTVLDIDALAAYCQVYARWVGAEDALAKTGMVIKTVAGNFIQSPYLSIANRALELMHRYEAEFGMTPSARTRIVVEKPQEESEFEVFMLQSQRAASG
jgi:P27 family predicted phage terminase small subunit